MKDHLPAKSDYHDSSWYQSYSANKSNYKINNKFTAWCCIAVCYQHNWYNVWITYWNKRGNSTCSWNIGHSGSSATCGAFNIYIKNIKKEKKVVAH